MCRHAGDEHQPGIHYGQRQQQPEKRSQEAEEGKAEGPRHAQDGVALSASRSRHGLGTRGTYLSPDFTPVGFGRLPDAVISFFSSSMALSSRSLRTSFSTLSS